MCLSALSVEDIEDVFGLLVMGFFLIELGEYLIYRETAWLFGTWQSCTGQTDGLGRAIQTQTQYLLELNHKLYARSPAATAQQDYE